MNKKYIPGVIIVEGKHDASKLSNLYDSTFVVTNGYEIPSEEIKFLNALSDDIQVIVLTDNDEAGKEIRNRLNAVRPNVINIEITAPKSSKKKGIAECLNENIVKALDKYVKEDKDMVKFDLHKLGLIGRNNSKDIREFIKNKFSLGYVSPKTINKRLNLLKINEEKLLEEIKNANSR